MSEGTNQSETIPRSRTWLAILITVLVCLSFFFQNTRRRGPFFEFTSDVDTVWEIQTHKQGWPLTYYRVREWSVIRSYFRHSGTMPFHVERPIGFNQQTWNLACNVILGLIATICTLRVTNYWRRQGRLPFQYSIRWFFAGTVLVATIVTFTDDYRVIAGWLLSIPIAFGIVCMPAAVGLCLYSATQRSDASLMALRRRHETMPISIPGPSDHEQKHVERQ